MTLEQHTLTKKDYLNRYEKGIWPTSFRSELINGVVIPMSPLYNRHKWAQKRIARLLEKRFGESRVFENGSIEMRDESLPTPDIHALRDASCGLIDHADNVAMIVEIADSTLKKDTINDGSGKLGVYARNGIAVVWVMDVKNKILYSYEDPDFGIYQTVTEHSDTIHFAGEDVPILNLLSY